MTLQELQAQYDVVGMIDLSAWTDNYETSTKWLRSQCEAVYQPAYTENQRIVFVHSHDYYVKNADSAGIILKNIQVALNETDISNYFALVFSTNPNIAQEIAYINSQSSDPVPVKFAHGSGEFVTTELTQHPYSRKEQYQYGSANPIKISLNEVSEQDKFLLSESKNFCIYPWIHMHAWPTGEAYPCCHATHSPVYGDTRKETLADVWNGTRMRQLRQNMLSDTPNETCRKCHEQEDSGFFSGRQSANKHHGHHIDRVHRTESDGTFNEFEQEFLKVVQKPSDTIIALAGEQLKLDYFTPNILSDWENRNLIQVLSSLFLVSDVTLTGNEDKDGPIIADKQLASFAFGIDSFLSYQVVFKRGNPSNFNRRVWNSFSTNQTVKPLQPIDFGPYVPNSLPSSNSGTTLSISKSQNVDA